MYTKYLVIGVNAAGFYALEDLRKHDPLGSITAINGEVSPPYKRTKVNKNFWPPGLDVKKFQLAEPSWYEENNITLINNTWVRGLELSSKTAYLEGGEFIVWDKLLICTGAEAYCPDSVVFRNAVSIRTYNDALKVEELIKASESSLIYGLGLEAVEAAAQLSQAGLHVCIAGREGELLTRHFSPQISGMIEDQFRIRNIPIQYNTSVDQILHIPSEKQTDSNKIMRKVTLDGNSQVYDFLLFSTGIRPRKELAEECGIYTNRGIVVNPRMETSVKDVYAAGDCVQLESGIISDYWHAAQDQGRTAAANMAGIPAIWPVKRYRIKLELYGEYFFSMRPFPEKDSENLSIEESVLSSGAFRLFYYKEDRLQGVEMTNDKTRAKLYEQAVNEEWVKKKVDEHLK